MKHRITYIRESSSPIDPDQMEVTKDTLHIRNLLAAKEHRLTLGLSELPRELLTLVKLSKELHIRWRSPRTTHGRAPHVSELSPGLHVFHSPESNGKIAAHVQNHVVHLLAGVFDPTLNDGSKGHAATFTSPPVASARFARSASNQLYSYLNSLGHLNEYVKSEVCSDPSQFFLDTADSLLGVSSLDVDYDYISRAVVLTAYWDQPAIGRPWNEVISEKALRSERIEVGVFNKEEATSKEEIKLGGVLIVIGEDTKSSSTLFSFPTRHHSLPKSSFRSSFDQPLGLHPVLRISLNINSNSKLIHSNPTCTFHAYLTLPSPLFLDRYAFTDNLFLDSHRLQGLRSVSGATDLEAPDWAVTQWGSAALFELQPVKGNNTNTVDVTIPLHSRYMSPTPGGYTNVSIPYPVVFYACKAMNDDLPPLSTNPFDRTNLGYDALFGERTIFYHVVPKPHSGPSSVELKLGLTIPVLDLNEASYIEPITVLVILLGSLWICWKLFGPLPYSPEESRVVINKEQAVKENRKKAQ